MSQMAENPDPLLPLSAKLDELEAIVRRRFEPKSAASAPTRTERALFRDAAAVPTATAQGVEPREAGTLMSLLARLFGGRR